MSAGAGIGSMPGEDFSVALRTVAEQTPRIVAFPELPARGPAAGMTGRAIGLLVEMGADLQPAGWRLTGGGGFGLDQRRARSLLAQDLDTIEEDLEGFDGTFKIQVAGPLTLSATIERPRGDLILADHGGRRDVAQSLAEGIGVHLSDVSRRLPNAQIILQIDEPALPAVLAATIPTASGWGRHRSVGQVEADASLRLMADVAHDHGARAVLHCCAAEVPVGLIAQAGFNAISFDLSLARGVDDWAEAFEGGVDLWTGVVPTTADEHPTDTSLVARVENFFKGLGFDHDSYADRLVVTPTCGLAESPEGWARRALSLSRTTAGNF